VSKTKATTAFSRSRCREDAMIDAYHALEKLRMAQRRTAHEANATSAPYA